MTPTHCPNCGAAMTEENSGKYCLYCGGKLPELEQHITNNYDNRVENHYHTTIIQQTPAKTVYKIEEPLPPEERVKEKPKDQITAFIISVILVIMAISSKISFFAFLAIVFLTFAIVKRQRTNYCPHCFYHKELNETKCRHCGKTIDSPLSRVIAAICADAVILFIAVAINAAPR